MDELNALTTAREKIEAEIDMIVQELTSPGINGEPPMGLKGPLVDSEGYPRADIDVFHARTQRNRFVVLQNDYRALMAKIEKLLPIIYAAKAKENSSSGTNHQPVVGKTKVAVSSSQADSTEVSVNTSSSLVPFATVASVQKDSPAANAGLQADDKVLAFGSANSENHRKLQAIAEIVGRNENQVIPLVIQRNNKQIELAIVPQKWDGRGLLGCHII